MSHAVVLLKVTQHFSQQHSITSTVSTLPQHFNFSIMADILAYTLFSLKFTVQIEWHLFLASYHFGQTKLSSLPP
ncbi:hypothetical protein E2C01_053289 [Portunus trituberculatus]|uniref:Uncharacterized protein n=1 Tax=Portunus trituberculatus TaxID=210409 RepID=A0A5B7GNY5_PORTR|nr:hypothetical protein [Portunus trituberculatus]